MSQREILFKAKSVYDGKWVCGDLLQYQDGSCVIHWYNHGIRVSTDVNPKTVCQYTGLADKNGVKIWEGDILEWKQKYILAGGAYALTAKYRYGDRLVVRCLPAGFMLCKLEDSCPDRPSANGKIDNYSLWNLHGFWEVVGNIYDQEDKG